MRLRFRDDIDEIRTLTSSATAANENSFGGDPQDAPLPRSFASGWQIGKPDLVLQIPSAINVKASGTIPYQMVTIETGLTEDKYVQAVEVLPTAREVVHHVLVFALPPSRRGEASANDSDGKLTSDELPEANRDRLLKLDTNKDGAITLEEAKLLDRLIPKK